jgi:hypothetical protein
MDSEQLNTPMSGQLLRVFRALESEAWLTLPEIHSQTQDPVSSISAQIRHLRKPEHGSHIIKKRRRGAAERGLFEYRLFSSKPEPERIV